MPITNERQRSQVHHGFTLLELVVVVGIIAILIGIAIPILAGARRSASATQCRSILKNIGDALAVLAAQRKGYTLLAGECRTPPFTSFDRLAPVLSDPLSSRYRYWTNSTSTLWPEVPVPFPYALIDIDEPSARVVADGVGWLKQVESHPVLQPYICPLVRNDPINTVAYVVFYDGSRGVDSPHESNTGYALNEWIFGYRTGNAPYPLRGKLTDIRSPANVLLAGDADIAKRRFPYGIWSMNDRPEPPTLDHYARGIAAKYGIAPDLGRHHGGLNLLFADGHVEGRGESQLDTVFLK